MHQRRRSLQNNGARPNSDGHHQSIRSHVRDRLPRLFGNQYRIDDVDGPIGRLNVRDDDRPALHRGGRVESGNIDRRHVAWHRRCMSVLRLFHPLWHLCNPPIQGAVPVSLRRLRATYAGKPGALA